MFHLLTNYDCMFSSTDLLFNLLSEYENFFPIKVENFLIADTLVYKMGLPVSYSYMNGNSFIQKINYKDISNDKVLKTCMNNAEHEVLGYLYTEVDKESDGKTHTTKQYVEVDYCTKKNIKEYYLISKKKFSGLFQRFIYPLDERNFIIEVEWNKQILSINRKTNNHYLTDHVDLYKKMVNIEDDNAEFITHSNVPNPRTVRIIREICNEIKRRINCIYYYKYCTVIKGEEFPVQGRGKSKEIIQIEEKKNILHAIKFHIKIDKNFKVYLLYCLSIQFNSIPLKNRKMAFFLNPVTTSEPIIGIFHHNVYFRLSKDTKEKRITGEHKEEIDLDEKENCISCEYYYDKEDMFILSFKLIIDNFNLAKHKELTVPLIIEKFLRREVEEDNEYLKKKIVLEKYINNSKTESFCQNEVLLCQECYLDNTYFLTKKISVEKDLKINRSPLYVDYKSIETKTDNLSEKEDIEFKTMSLLIGGKNPDLIDFYKKETDYEKKELENKEIRKFTKLTNLRKTSNDLKLFIHNKKKKDINDKKIEDYSKYTATPIMETAEVDNTYLNLKKKNTTREPSDKLSKRVSVFGFCPDLLKYYDDKNGIVETISKYEEEMNVVKDDSDKMCRSKSKEANDSNNLRLTAINSELSTSDYRNTVSNKISQKNLLNHYLETEIKKKGRIFNYRIGNLSKLSSEEGINYTTTNSTIPDFTIYQKKKPNKTVLYFTKQSNFLKKTMTSFNNKLSFNVSNKTLKEKASLFPKISDKKARLSKNFERKTSFSIDKNNSSNKFHNIEEKNTESGKLKLNFDKTKVSGVSNFISFIRELKSFKSYNKTKKY